jgi:hypothetical protein
LHTLPTDIPRYIRFSGGKFYVFFEKTGNPLYFAAWHLHSGTHFFGRFAYFYEAQEDRNF